MGVLLFKGNTATASIDDVRVSNQQLTFQKFRNPERTLNKSLSTYQFKEKLEAEIQFQYEGDTYYRVLRKLLDDRNSLQDSLLFMPVPYSESKAATIYEPSTATNKAYFITWADLVKPWTKDLADVILEEVDATSYTNIASPTSSTYISTSSTGYNGIILSFDLTAFKDTFTTQDIRRLTLNLLGLQSSPLRSFIWSPSSEEWYNIGDTYYYEEADLPLLYKQTISQFSLPQGFSSVASGFLDANYKVHFLICNGELSEIFLLKYARLLVNGYYVIPESPEDIENYAVHFTGAGRTGSLNLLEI